MNLPGSKLRRRSVAGILLLGMACGARAQEPIDAPAPDSAQAQTEPQYLDMLNSITQDAGDQESATANVPEAEATAADDAKPVSGDAPTSAQQSTTEILDTIPVSLRSKAQQAEATIKAPPRSLEEIVVTATKRAEPVRDIPATINVLAGKDLEREGVQSIDQIVTLVPGVNLSDDGTGGTAKRITIRGISTAPSANPTAGTLFGDIPFSDPFIPKVQLDPNPFDMATVEVLKGPQGTLFGGTGLNGLIRYVPESPKFDAFQLKYYTQRNSYPGNGGSAWSYGGVFNTPFADHTAALRVMAFKRNSPGYVDDSRSNGKPDVNTLSQYGFRGALAWQPNEDWKISLLGATQHTNEDDISYTENYNGQLEHDTAPRPSPAQSVYTLGALTVERSFDWATLTSQTSYFKKKYNVSLDASRIIGGLLPQVAGQVPLIGGADDNHSQGVTQEFRLASVPGDSPWKWLAGAFYYKLHLYDCAAIGALQGLPPLQIPDFLNGLLTSPCPGNESRIGDQLVVGQLIGDVTLKEQALFGELTRELGDDWEATLGARVYRIQTSGSVATSGVLYSSSNQGQAVSRDADVGQHGISPKGSIVYHPTEDLRAYLSASRGFRFGGPQIAASTPTTTVPATYRSDSLWNYELGLRTDWLDRTLRIDASAYYIDWKNPQIYQISSDGLTNYIDNVGGAKGKGVETSLSYLIPFVPGLSLDASASWNRTTTATVFMSQKAGAIPVGSPWPLAPKWQTSTTLSYTVPVATWQLGGSVRHTYLGKACNTIECTRQVFGYRTLDLSLFATPGDDSYWPGLSVSLNNLTDERGYSNIVTNPSPASDTINYIAPRALVLRLSGSFQ